MVLGTTTDLGSNTADTYFEQYIGMASAKYFAVCEHRLTAAQLPLVSRKLKRMGLAWLFNPAAADPDRGVQLTGGVGFIAPLYDGATELPADLHTPIAGVPLLKSRIGWG